MSGITGEIEPGPVLAGGIGTCFDRDLMAGTLTATSPFGVERTGRASAGYHLGLDLVSSNGNGTHVYAGVPGTVVFSAANRTNSVFVETPDGRQRVGYLHGQPQRAGRGRGAAFGMVPVPPVELRPRAESVRATPAAGRACLADRDVLSGQFSLTAGAIGHSESKPKFKLAHSL